VNNVVWQNRLYSGGCITGPHRYPTGLKQTGAIYPLIEKYINSTSSLVHPRRRGGREDADEWGEGGERGSGVGGVL
jgi:hypothetical protein